MSKMVKAVESNREDAKFEAKKPVTNFMNGVSFEWNPIDTLKMVTASSIFGEPAYYRNGEFSEKAINDAKFNVTYYFNNYVLDFMKSFDDKKTSQIMEEVIDNALSYDFKETLEWARTLRKDFFMRLNPQVIMVRAAIHPDRQKFTEENPGLFNKINMEIMSRADEPASQLTYYLYKNGSKNNIPGILKKSWANKYSQLTPYDIYKYRNTGIGMIDTIRVCHAKSPIIDQLMKTGTVEIEENNKTWETYKASGMSWREILNTIRMPHMALLRNLRGIFSEINDVELAKKLLDQLKSGVEKGKQFPFRYYKAYEQIDSSSINHKALVLDALEECMDISLANMPKLKGKTMCLSDNSGSAWSGFTSEYGNVTVATIDNLSSVITAMNSEEGYVGKFGDKLKVYPISKRNGCLSQTEKINKGGSSEVGASTENGIWLFFDKAIKEKEHWDNIFIYSDQQAGHGGLYGTPSSIQTYVKTGFGCKDKYNVDVAKLIDVYRKTVNPHVNVFSVQTAGYNNVCVPESGYRTTLLYGWTGKELIYADQIIKFWDEKKPK